ncbi:MAG: hypothetical protein H6Q59_2632, partial [Firmicutes bacterium]|nr:hypothetical protein [Bacillota bacterium]
YMKISEFVDYIKQSYMIRQNDILRGQRMIKKESDIYLIYQIETSHT